MPDYDKSKPGPQNLLKNADPKKIKAFLQGFSGAAPTSDQTEAMKRKMQAGQG